MSDDSIDDIYTSNSITAKDLKGRTVKLTITGAIAKTFKDEKGEQTKIVLSFEETDKTMVLNKTNANRIAESHGRAWRKWPGKVIKIHPERVEFKGDIVDAIRVDLPEGSRSEYDDEEPVSI